jgi:Protein of unknown function (DUF664)
MTDSDTTPWEPPLAGTETEHLVGALERLCATFRWKADGLYAAGLRVRVGASALTIGGLLKHLVEDNMLGTRLGGEPLGERWGALGWEGDWAWAFTSHGTLIRWTCGPTSRRTWCQREHDRCTSVRRCGGAGSRGGGGGGPRASGGSGHVWRASAIGRRGGGVDGLVHRSGEVGRVAGSTVVRSTPKCSTCSTPTWNGAGTTAMDVPEGRHRSVGRPDGCRLRMSRSVVGESGW